jgi:hypothetical protein
MYKVNSTKILLRSGFFLITLFLFCISQTDLFSQQRTGTAGDIRRGLIISNNGDSLMGSIKGVYKNQYSDFIWFRDSDGDGNEYKRYTPYDISSFGNRTGSSRYTSAAIPLSDESELIFVRQFIEGEYDLLFYDLKGREHLVIRDQYNRITDVTYHSFRDMEGSINTKLSSEEFMALLQNVFDNNEMVQPLLINARPTKRSMTDLIIKYHNNTGKGYHTFGVKNLGLAAGFTAGITGDQYYVKALDNTVRSSYSISPYGGLNISLYSKNTGVGVIAESSLSKKSFHYSYSIDNADLTSYFETFIETIYLNNRLGLSFSERKGNKLSPFFEIGGSASFFISPQYDNYFDLVYNDVNVVTSELDHDELHSDTYFGMYLRPGAALRINARSVLKIAGEYSVSLGMDGEKLSIAGFSLIYQFKLK